ncbi:hypothetical protein K466DRAFT_296378 [Polyporus arcularius HHB13444]|uniref:Uncharacterized protein n=1 Tax=Polyporus arcularius HHB13444 TaxID=1314778 RepID=A0A5C3PRA8_9APHY|nr:hypothetical protein K466DRAFT_296378 [Polyporus arcularius HHB13444]
MVGALMPSWAAFSAPAHPDKRISDPTETPPRAGLGTSLESIGVLTRRVASLRCASFPSLVLGAQQCRPSHADRCGHRPTSTDRVISE